MDEQLFIAIKEEKSEETGGKYIQFRLLTKLVSLFVQRGPGLSFWFLSQGFLALVE